MSSAMMKFWVYIAFWIVAIIYHVLSNDRSAYGTANRVGIALILSELASLSEP